MNRFGFYLAHFCIVAVCSVLLGAFGVQFAEGELPCPLCVLQRMAMLLCALGPAFVILQARAGETSAADFATGYGLSVVAAVAGAAISGRQVLLHIAPPDPGFGDPVLGMHLYSWAFVVFATVLLVSGLNLIFTDALRPRGVRVGLLSTLVIGLLGLLILGNAVSMFFQEGSHWTLPDDPDHYQLFDDVKRLFGRS
ncbi:MAG TPA: disulfide bond formation protein B [Pirellulales bacterium]